MLIDARLMTITGKIIRRTFFDLSKMASAKDSIDQLHRKVSSR